MKHIKSVYLITRLYNTDDKIRTCELENFLLSKYADLKIYMPYRDIEEDKITERWKETIFDKDIKAINSSDALLGYWDGTEYDEGIGFEIGYALSKNKSIFVLNSDFLKYSFYNTLHVSNYPDPILEALNINSVKNIFEMAGLDSFHDDLLLSKMNLLNSLNLNITADNIGDYRRARKIIYKRYLEYGSSLIFYNIFNKIKTPSDYLPKRFIENESYNFAKIDLDSLMHSETAYIVVAGPEMNVGNSIICGLCYGFGVPFYLVNDRLNTMISMDGSTMPTNLMIDCACESYVDVESI